MGRYTESRRIAAETLSIDDDDFEDKLREIARQFRGFDDALTEFIIEHGYTGPASDVNAKALFLRGRFKAEGIKLPRDFKEWFVPVKKLDRDTLYQVCFAFRLNVAETEDFFRRIFCARAFDCHTVKEAVYYFCIKNSRSYAEANKIIEQIPKPKKAKTLPESSEVLYTQAIVQEIDIADEQELIQYITSHIDSFRYSNATAGKFIQTLWNNISKPDGKAAKEAGRKRWMVHYEFYEEDDDADKRVLVSEDTSTWAILSQILGLTKGTEKEYATKYNRSLLSAFNKNTLMPLKAAYCFPSRQNIEKIVRGELVGDDEVMRKLLILLKFYDFWADSDNTFPHIQGDEKHPDAERCLYEIDKWLADAGYPVLYAGNPYDWVFMWSLNRDDPLEAFRTYMGEVFMEAASQNQA